MTSVITLLTDYGLEDGFVASCHGVIISIAPQTRIIDVCHLVPAGDIRRGAAILAQTLPYLPAGVHVAAVDPSAAGARRSVAVEAGNRLFIGPDNGLLSWALLAAGGARTAYEIANTELFLSPVSPTFHGRDIYAPVAAHLCGGRKPADLGPEIPLDRLLSLPAPTARRGEDAVEGEVLSLDRYGNVQLSVTADDLAALGIRVGGTVAVSMGRRQVTMPFRDTYAAVPPGTLVVFTDSAGLVAFAVNSGDAAQRLGLPPGAHVRLARGPEI
ncbi:SAM-dependent chlorinase/fluorinase [Sphaerisporangium sp. TRM90804]|uniref:SAM hydrolase/SAM-dependent halogenase family protein n=1 Tax=Sphaerisporangium sp. TRM90804 TaxID=3031113 RepID=UPI0024480700|nr:SAM-dependent chlorinase/fluorinase [Sphaerisporangium sp. TRM90804]MDH2430429.1 SAM-dependent chlorinase/fluorinase [Sphaerisporangium sp. TRM90804]